MSYSSDEETGEPFAKKIRVASEAAATTNDDSSSTTAVFEPMGISLFGSSTSATDSATVEQGETPQPSVCSKTPGVDLVTSTESFSVYKIDAPTTGPTPLSLEQAQMIQSSPFDKITTESLCVLVFGSAGSTSSLEGNAPNTGAAAPVFKKAETTQLCISGSATVADCAAPSICTENSLFGGNAALTSAVVDGNTQPNIFDEVHNTKECSRDGIMSTGCVTVSLHSSQSSAVVNVMASDGITECNEYSVTRSSTAITDVVSNETTVTPVFGQLQTSTLSAFQVESEAAKTDNNAGSTTAVFETRGISSATDSATPAVEQGETPQPSVCSRTPGADLVTSTESPVHKIDAPTTGPTPLSLEQAQMIQSSPFDKITTESLCVLVFGSAGSTSSLEGNAPNTGAAAPVFKKAETTQLCISGSATVADCAAPSICTENSLFGGNAALTSAVVDGNTQPNIFDEVHNTKECSRDGIMSTGCVTVSLHSSQSSAVVNVMASDGITECNEYSVTRSSTAITDVVSNETTVTPVFGQLQTSTLSAFQGFGSTDTTNATSGTPVKFTAVTATDTMLINGVTQTISTRYHCITCMKEYESKSLEELHLEDYMTNRKGPQKTSQQPSLFGTSTGGLLFGAGTSTSTGTGDMFTQEKVFFGGTSVGISGLLSTPDSQTMQPDVTESTNSQSSSTQENQLVKVMLSYQCDNWREMSAQTEVELVIVEKGTNEYNTICEGIHKSLSANVTKVQRIQNPYIWGYYLIKKEEYILRGIQFNELVLYHETTESNLDSIVRNNLDWRRSGRRAKYGKGIVLGDLRKINQSTVSRIIRRVSTGIVQRLQQFIKFPSTEQEYSSNRNLFYEMSQFPGVIGVIDCTHIPIQSPRGQFAELYRNRKGWMSLNVQLICGPQMEIMDIVSRWPGSTHDSRIF